MPRDELYVRVARNALLIAGHEMGKQGDHWPAIKAAIYGITREFEALVIEDDVSEQMQEHLHRLIGRYEELLHDAPPDMARELRPIVAEMREVYDARFAPVTLKNLLSSSLPQSGKQFIPWRTTAHIMEEMGE